MTHGKIVGAHKALMNLNRQQLSLPVAYSVYKMMEKTRKAWDFQAEQERKLLEKYQPKSAESGRLDFVTKEDEEEFVEYLKELNNMESDVEVTPISIHLTENIQISPSDIEALDGLIAFVE